MNLHQIQIRIARPSHDLERVRHFYEDGLGFDVLYRFGGHGDFEGIMLGMKGAPYHLELTRHTSHPVEISPSVEDLLVFYLSDQREWEDAVHRLKECGYETVSAFNSYWDRVGATFVDPDGYRVVLQNASWDRVEEA